MSRRNKESTRGWLVKKKMNAAATMGKVEEGDGDGEMAGERWMVDVDSVSIERLWEREACEACVPEEVRRGRAGVAVGGLELRGG